MRFLLAVLLSLTACRPDETVYNKEYILKDFEVLSSSCGSDACCEIIAQSEVEGGARVFPLRIWGGYIPSGRYGWGNFSASYVWKNGWNQHFDCTSRYGG